MCFAPQQRALFRHLKCQKWSEHGVVCTFGLGNVPRATTACTFSTSQLPKVVRTWCGLYILTSKCASRHNGVHFFDMSTSKSCPNMVCFVHFDLDMCFEMLRATTACTFSSLIWPDGSAPAALASLPNFRPPGATNHWKNTVFRDFPTFSRICIFFLLTLSLLSSSLFCSSLLPAASHLCFSSVYIVGSLTSKLPSVIIYQWIILNRLSMGIYWFIMISYGLSNGLSSFPPLKLTPSFDHGTRGFIQT